MQVTAAYTTYSVQVEYSICTTYYCIHIYRQRCRAEDRRAGTAREGARSAPAGNGRGEDARKRTRQERRTSRETDDGCGRGGERYVHLSRSVVDLPCDRRQGIRRTLLCWVSLLRIAGSIAVILYYFLFFFFPFAGLKEKKKEKRE